MLRSLPARTQGAGITFFLRDARSAYKGIPRSAVIVHAVSPSPGGISHPSSQWSPEQLYLVRLLLTYLLHNSNTREEGETRRAFSHQHHPRWNRTHWMFPWQLFWPKASSALFAKQKGSAHTHSPRQPAAPSTLVHSRQYTAAPLWTATHHLPHPAAARCCESQCFHLLLTVRSGAASLQETGIIAFHLQEGKRIKPFGEVQIMHWPKP